MATHKSNINFEKLIQNLADMYPYDIAEVIFVELVANALDSGATSISIDWDDYDRILIVLDNGEGMTKPQFEEYHDFAAELKTRGNTIGFAGVGAKISFNVADRVVTESISDTFSGGSDWFLRSKKNLVWEEIPTLHLIGKGTRVEVHFKKNSLFSPYTNDYLVQLLKRHFLPLTETHFLNLYSDLNIYKNGVEFELNGKKIKPTILAEQFGLKPKYEFYPKRGKKRIGYGILGLAEMDYPLGEDMCGVLLSTRGKVIKAELFNQFPGEHGPRIFGLVEIPDLVKHLTTSKTDFIRKRGKEKKDLELILESVRSEFKAWLAGLGVQAPEISDSKEALQLEKEVRKLLDDVPELGEILGIRSKQISLKPKENGEVQSEINEDQDLNANEEIGINENTTHTAIIENADPVPPEYKSGDAPVESEQGIQKAEPISSKSRRGPKIDFEERPEKIELAWVEGGKIIINKGSSAYKKANSNKATLLLNMLAIGCAVLRYSKSIDNQPDLKFIDRMLGAWGEKQ